MDTKTETQYISSKFGALSVNSMLTPMPTQALHMHNNGGYIYNDGGNNSVTSTDIPSNNLKRPTPKNV